ncbi:MAG: ATP-grasp domain-containing protein [Candidatus Krumholzibacteriia bacterium]
MSARRGRTLLVLGGSHDQLFLIRTARALGVRTLVVDGNPAAPGLREGTLGEPVSFGDLPALFACVDRNLAAGEPLAGVLTMGSDVPHVMAAVAARYGWVGPSIETGAVATDKLAMKERFAAQGVPVPRFARVDDAGEALERWREWGCERVVVKPTDRAGSRGVSLVEDRSFLAPAHAHARRCGRSGVVLLEEHLPGPQISTETLVHGGRAETPGLADRLYEGMEIFHPQIMENGGWIPSRVAGTPLEARVKSLVEAAAGALGVSAGIAKGDVVVHPDRGPVMIEMAARLSGGDFSEALVPLGTGVNYVREAVRVALGEAPDWDALRPRCRRVVANRYFFLPPGRLEQITGLEPCRDLPGVATLEIFYRAGDEVPPIRSHGERVGRMVVAGGSRAAVQAVVDTIYEGVAFRVGGRWTTARPADAVPPGTLAHPVPVVPGA